MDPLKLHEQRFVLKVIELLEHHPEDFSAMWFTGTSLDESVQYKDKEIIIYKTGMIYQPIKPELTAGQKEHIKQLCQRIFDRDSLTILKRYDCV